MQGAVSAAKENPGRSVADARGEVAMWRIKRPKCHPVDNARKGERVSPAGCAAKESPAIAVTAMRGEFQ